MDYSEKMRALSGEALDEFSRMIFEEGEEAINDTVKALVNSGRLEDHELAATLVSDAPIKTSGGDYYAARYGKSFDKSRVDMFLDICASCGIPEDKYIATLIATGYADKDGALYAWKDGADVYLLRRATENFNAVADYIDRYDKRFVKYGVLIKVDKAAAASRLINKIINEKNIDKAAIRDVLMDRPELADHLFSLYAKAKAHERAAIVRLLLVYKNDWKVKRFLDEVVVKDGSKTVLAVLKKSKKAAAVIPKKGKALSFFETALAEGKGYTYEDWQTVLAADEYAAVADRLFFCLKDDGICPLVYNKGVFLDMTDTPVILDPEDVIYVLHPADLPPDHEILSMQIEQPVLQIARHIYLPINGESDCSKRRLGAIVPRSEFDENFKKLGFVFADKRSDGEESIALKFSGDYAIGVAVDLTAGSDTASCGNFYYYSAKEIVKLGRKIYVSSTYPLPIRNVPKREFSELTRFACKLFRRD